MKIGFELEAFCFNPQGEPILVPAGVPMDECGWLAEVRSEPHSNVRKAMYLLEAEMEEVSILAKKNNCVLQFTPLFEIPRDLKVQAARRSGKGVISYQNVYGFQTHRNSTKFQTASLHISFTNEQEWHYTDQEKREKTHKYQGFIDHAKLIVGLDKAFREELIKSKRNPGFYEVKGDGRIEYRSLPNNVNFHKVVDVLIKLL